MPICNDVNTKHLINVVKNRYAVIVVWFQNSCLFQDTPNDTNALRAAMEDGHGKP